MAYDCIVIGGGLSGLTCAVKCAEAGVRTAVISNGMNALHFSSGSIDVLGHLPSGMAVARPFERMAELKIEQPDHPYSRIGAATVVEALDFFAEQTARAGLVFYKNGIENHPRVTGLGVLKPAYLSQESAFNDRLKTAVRSPGAKIAILNFYGYRDYYAAITAEQLKKSDLFRGAQIVTGEITLPAYTGTGKNLHEFRSTDLARVFDSDRYLPRIAGEIVKAAQGAGVVSMPAFIGIDRYAHVHKRLEELTGCLIYEIPTLPPSIPGLRLDNALKSRLAALGGVYSQSDKVTGGRISGDVLEEVVTANSGATGYAAGHYVLATGSFISGGLKCAFNQLEEPVFGLKIRGSQDRREWYSKKFFDTKGHPFLSYGVETDDTLNPYAPDGTTVKNLFCTGALLAGYDPVREGSGGGVAISTGYFAAKKIISAVRKA